MYSSCPGHEGRTVHARFASDARFVCKRGWSRVWERGLFWSVECPALVKVVTLGTGDQASHRRSRVLQAARASERSPSLRIPRPLRNQPEISFKREISPPVLSSRPSFRDQNNASQQQSVASTGNSEMSQFKRDDPKKKSHHYPPTLHYVA